MKPATTPLGLYAATLFLSAALLFLVQPMFAKLALPLLGGAPAVWNICMVFFQAALLAGYAYAHFSTRMLGFRRQALVHAAVMLLALVALPLAVPAEWVPDAQASPVRDLLLLLAIAVGLPFFVIASTAPLLQKWFSTGGHAHARDPYHLYAASNLGSLSALLAYPLLIEPTLGRDQLGALWSAGYVLLIALVAACAVPLWRAAAGIAPGAPATAADPAAPPTWRRRLRWIALAAAPSSLMLGVTTHLTTDVAAVPLLWVVPLALYLLTFVLVFARPAPVAHRWMLRLLPTAAVIMLLMLLMQATEPAWLVMFLHLAVFFIAAMACHGELARDRPDVGQLTEYYLALGVGGVLGGAFNALVAPMVFATPVEYPVALVVACILVPAYVGFFAGAPARAARPEAGRGRWARVADIGYPVLVGAVAMAGVLYANQAAFADDRARLILSAGIPAVACFALSERPLRFGLALAAVLLAGQLDTATRGVPVETQRSFFGIHRVTHARVEQEAAAPQALNLLFHGTTLHGAQLRDAAGAPAAADEPLTYYRRKGPIGQLFAAFRGTDPEALRRVGVVGMGAGALLAYAEAGDRFTLYEIDPSVVRIATDVRLFTFHREAIRRGATVDVTLGDARLQLAAAGGGYDLLVLDAFSSDAIPMHLVTREAFQTYLGKLDADGILAVHMSNRYLRLEGVLAAVAEALGLVCAVQYDRVSERDRRAYRYSSDWLVMARDLAALRPLAPDAPTSRWRVARAQAGVSPWTDDYSNILRVFDWGLRASAWPPR